MKRGRKRRGERRGEKEREEKKEWREREKKKRCFTGNRIQDLSCGRSKL